MIAPILDENGEPVNSNTDKRHTMFAIEIKRYINETNARVRSRIASQPPLNSSVTVPGVTDANSSQVLAASPGEENKRQSNHEIEAGRQLQPRGQTAGVGTRGAKINMEAYNAYHNTGAGNEH